MNSFDVVPSSGTTQPYLSQKFKDNTAMVVLCFLTTLSEAITYMLGGKGKLE